MEFNTTQQCVYPTHETTSHLTNFAPTRYQSSEPFPAMEGSFKDAAAVMYSGGALATSAQTSQSSSLAPSQTMTTWAMRDTTQTVQAPHRHTMMFLDPRPIRADAKTTRPLSMTAVSSSKHPGFQNPQGEYLPQPHMPPPVVQPPKMTQASLGQRKFSIPWNRFTLLYANHHAPAGWVQRKSYGDLEFPNLEQDLPDYGHGMLGLDDDTTVIDLRKFTYLGRDHAHDMFSESSRRMSESTNSMSSHGPFADVPHFDDSPPLDNLHQDSDWSTFEASVRSQFDPTSSPRPPSLIRSASRSRVSPAPSLRSSPYTLESTRNKRWSTGMYPGQPAPRPPQSNRYSSYFGTHLNPMTNFSPYNQEAMHTLPTQNYPFPPAHFGSNAAMMYPTSDPFPEISRPLPSQGIFRLLQSNADRLTGCYSHCADLSDPPDLYSSLSEKPADPPEEDMNPADPDMVPHEQELRFPGDLYTPKWVRGQGNKREGWCGLCKPGRWLVLKNSAFWYDKSFTHGVSAATGAAFQSPQDTRRTEGNLDVWEGLCGSCGDWIALVSSKKKGTTWFRHAYKCHTHPKVKDGAKRRREMTSNAPRSNETTDSAEPTITVSSEVAISKAEPTDDQESSSGLERDIIVKDESQYLGVKTEEDPTPVSTPQLSYTSMSTPMLGSMHTPSSLYHPTPSDRKRYSVVFDNPVFTQSFSTHLEAFAEQEGERTPPHDEEMSSAGDVQSSSATFEPTFTLTHDGTFTQATASHMPRTHDSSFATNSDHFMTSNDEANSFFSHQATSFNFSAPTTQAIEFRVHHPPEGNWI